MSDTTTTTALDALLADYRHLEARGDDAVINEFRDGLVADAIADRENLTAALRECVAAMDMMARQTEQCAGGRGPEPPTWSRVGALRSAATKARAALGE